MDLFPQMLFRQPGKEPMHGDFFSWCAVHDEAELASALADGWHETTTAAKEAFHAATIPVPPGPDDHPPTRAEMEQKAKELGIKVDARWGDKRLSDEIAKALKG